MEIVKNSTVCPNGSLIISDHGMGKIHCADGAVNPKIKDPFQTSLQVRKQPNNYHKGEKINLFQADLGVFSTKIRKRPDQCVNICSNRKQLKLQIGPEPMLFHRLFSVTF